MEAHSQAASFKKFFVFVKPHRLGLLGILGLSIAATGLSLAQPYLTKILIDDGLLGRNMDKVILACVLIVVAGLFSSALGGLNRWHYTRISGHILFAIREHVYSHLQTLSPNFYTEFRGGDIMARLDGDISEVQRFAVDSLLAFINGILALVITVSLMLWLDWRLAILAFILLPLQVLLLRYLRPRVEAETKVVRERSSDLMAFFFERLPLVKFIQSVGAESREEERLKNLNDVYLKDLLKLQMTNFWTSAGPAFLTSLATAIVFVVGGFRVIDGVLTLGTLIAFSVYMARATGPVQTLLGLYVAIHRARVSLNRVAELTDREPDVKSPSSPVFLPADASGAISIEDISFGYKKSDPLIFSEARATIEAGSKVGIVGMSGVGKTTLIDLLHRHFDPQAGTIRVDGVDIRTLDLQAFRQRIAVVAQDMALLPGTVADNIRYAVPDADDEAVEEASRNARLSALPNALATEVGPRGSALSGGQRQRIAIARALLQKPLILILDEATSELDIDTEAEIITEVDALFGDKTRLIISHRKETLVGCDQLLNVKDGKLVSITGPA